MEMIICPYCKTKFEKTNWNKRFCKYKHSIRYQQLRLLPKNSYHLLQYEEKVIWQEIHNGKNKNS